MGAIRRTGRGATSRGGANGKLRGLHEAHNAGARVAAGEAPGQVCMLALPSQLPCSTAMRQKGMQGTR